MAIKKRPGVSNLDALVEERLKMLNPHEVQIPILAKVKSFIDKALLEEKRTLYIFTDYDVDGVTSDACAVKLFRYAYPETKIIHRTPHRLSEGYGFSLKVLPEVPDNSLLITIDNGIVAFEPIKAAKEKGCKVIVIDHHLGKEDCSLPDADLIVDPNAIGGQAEFTGYCGCGLTYKLSQEYDLPKELSDELRGLAALATVADCVPLKEENWLIAKDLPMALNNYPIYLMAQAYNLYGLNEGDAGFKICPTLNAPGRLEDAGAEKSARFLLGDKDLLEELIKLNEERKALTDVYLEKAEKIIQENSYAHDNAICVVMDAPEGLVGIIAGRIAEKYQCPAFVMARIEEGMVKGSARTFGDNHLKKILDNCSDLLGRYGGHAAAAGLTLPECNLAEFRKRVCSLSTREISEDVYYDIELSPYYVQKSIIEALNTLEEIRPFGEANEEPLFYIPNVRLFPQAGKTYKTMGADNQHLKLFGKDFDIVYFGKAAEYLAHPYDRVNVVGKLGANHFNGKISYQIEALYIEEAKREFKKTTLQAALDKRAKERI